MKRLYLAYADETIWRQVVAKIPWGQNLLILNKLSDATARLYYLQATAKFGWSRNVLLNQLKAGTYERAVALLSEEVHFWHCHTQARYGFGARPPQGSSGTCRAIDRFLQFTGVWNDRHRH